MLVRQQNTLIIMNERYSRQNFLGGESDSLFARLNVGIVGLGGGGSHIAQQLAHLGVKNFILVDHDSIEESNLNRLVGGTADDVRNERKKVDILARVIHGVNEDADISIQSHKWQNVAHQIRECDCIFGCVDSLDERRQLESFARRFMIPYIDIGIDVNGSGERTYITGQVAKSIPSKPCLWCLNILNEQSVNKEVQEYGAAGGQPQVVWANGIVASAAVGMFVELFTPWGPDQNQVLCLDYDGNKHSLEASNRMSFPWVKEGVCEHYPRELVGDPFFKISKTLKYG